MNGQESPFATSGLRAVCRDKVVSDTTLNANDMLAAARTWRWGKRGWIRLVNVCGKSYVDMQSLADFDQPGPAANLRKLLRGASS